MNQIVFSTPRVRRVNLDGDIADMPGGISAKMIRQAIENVAASDVIELRVHSRGGSAFEGLAMATALREHPAKKYGYVDGLAASAATLPLMVCDVVHCPANAILMIHDPSAVIFGKHAELENGKKMLDSVKSAAISLYVKKTRKSADEIGQLMRDETWMSGERAVQLGFADTMTAPLPSAPTMAQSKMAFESGVAVHI